MFSNMSRYNVKNGTCNTFSILTILRTNEIQIYFSYVLLWAKTEVNFDMK